MQNQNCGEKPKINRLKRANRSKKSDLLNEVELIRPDDQKSSHTSTMKNTRPPNTSGSRDLLNMETSSAWCPQQSSGRLSTRGGSDLHGHKATSPLTSLSHNLRSPSQFIGDVHTREEILQQVQTQNPHFPVRRVFQTLLLMRLGESNPVVPVTRKRKQEVESHSDGCFSKRRRSCQGGSETLNTSKGHVSSGHETINRLRRNPLPVRDAAVDQTRQNKGHAGHSDDVKHTTDVEHTDDVPLTEKFRPRSCDEVIGNSAVVRKLYSWLKEWRTRADVEERGKRREERQIKKKSNERLLKSLPAADEVTLHEEDKKSGAAVISLILFEEVDIVFEEDVGFLAAVKSLMTTTKRPIILTANGEPTVQNEGVSHETGRDWKR
ncbi:ATPase family AAA domain-containing protein 5 [Bagarius yarrelli]|uniref:ATPase family AAA domain-containing protein 5 n=1 Tax=Bagarius yarrelli TaxID=175774 RepID=A0A556VW87_BAGYA|nr:ATPase family AAA domain-containing protein 5 [Bagarius yarrelli]